MPDDADEAKRKYAAGRTRLWEIKHPRLAELWAVERRPKYLRKRDPRTEPLFPQLIDPRLRWVDTLEEYFSSFVEIRDRLEEQPAVTVIRWDWLDPERDKDFMVEIDDQVRDHFCLSCWDVSRWVTFMVSCPVDKSEEPAIWDWLSGPRVLGAQRSVWAPLVEHSP